MAYQYLSREKRERLVPRKVHDDWHGPEDFVKASEFLPDIFPSDGPAEFLFRTMVYEYLDERG